MSETGKGGTASKLRMKRVLSCLVEGHFGLTAGECWWMNHDQVLLWLEEELPAGSSSRFRVDMVSTADLVDCVFEVQKRLPSDFCPMPKGYLHLGAYNLVDEKGLESFRNQLARSNPALKLFGASYLPPPLAKYLKDLGIQQKALATPPAKRRKERTTARPTGKVTTRLRKQAIDRLRQEKERALETAEQASAVAVEQVTAKDQESSTDGTGRRRFEDLLRQKMGAAGAALVKDDGTGQFAAASEISEAIRNLPLNPVEGKPGASAEVSGEPGGARADEEKPKARKARRKRLTAKTGQEVKAAGRKEPAASDDFKPEEMSGLDALILAAGQTKKKPSAKAAPAPDDEAIELSDAPGGDDAIELSDDKDDDAPLELTTHDPDDEADPDEPMELSDDESGEYLELTGDAPDDDKSGEYLELTADEPDDDEPPAARRGDFEGLSESFAGAAKAESRPDTWEFDATPEEDEPEEAPEPGEKDGKEKKDGEGLPPGMESELAQFLGVESGESEDSKDLPPELESELAQFLGMAAASPTGDFKPSSATPMPGLERPPSRPKLSRDERRLLPAALGPGTPPTLMLRIMDPAQLRRTLDLTISERRAVFRVRPTDKLEPGDPLKIFLSLPAGSYMELDGLVYEDKAPGTHMVVEPLAEDDFLAIREAVEM